MSGYNNNKLSTWEWFIPTIDMVMTGGWFIIVILTLINQPIYGFYCNLSHALHRFQGSQPPPWPIWPRGDVPVFALQHPLPKGHPGRVIETYPFSGIIPEELVHI